MGNRLQNLKDEGTAKLYHSPPLDAEGERQLRVALELYGVKIAPKTTTIDAMNAFTREHDDGRLFIPLVTTDRMRANPKYQPSGQYETSTLTQFHVQAVIAHLVQNVPAEKIAALVQESYSAPANNEAATMRYEIANEAYRRQTIIAIATEHGISKPEAAKQFSAPLTPNEFERARAALYVLNPPDRKGADEDSFFMFGRGYEGAKPNANAQTAYQSVLDFRAAVLDPTHIAAHIAIEPPRPVTLPPSFMSELPNIPHFGRPFPAGLEYAPLPSSAAPIFKPSAEPIIPKGVTEAEPLVRKTNYYQPKDGVITHRDLQAIELTLSDAMLVETVAQLAMRPRVKELAEIGEASSGIEELSHPEKFALEYAIDTLARRNNIYSHERAVPFSEDMSTEQILARAADMMNPYKPLVSGVDGEFNQVEILGDIRGVTSKQKIRNLFEQDDEILGMRTVLHTAPVGQGARLTSPFGKRHANKTDVPEAQVTLVSLFKEQFEGLQTPHRGHDFGPNPLLFSTPVVASAAGEVLAYWNDHPTFGNCVILMHADGTASLYAHMAGVEFPALDEHYTRMTADGVPFYYNKDALRAARGDANSTYPVTQSQLIGIMGDTGASAKGEPVPLHLHYEQLTNVDMEKLNQGIIVANRRVPIYSVGAKPDVYYDMHPQDVHDHQVIFNGTAAGESYAPAPPPPTPPSKPEEPKPDKGVSL